MGLGIRSPGLRRPECSRSSPVQAADRIKTHSDAVGQFVRVVGMHQHPHLGRQVIDAIKVAFGEGAEVPQAGVHLLEGLIDAVLIGLVGMLGLGVVQPRAVEPGQILVVGAGPVAQGLPFGICRVHCGQGVDDPLWGLRVFDGFAQAS